MSEMNDELFDELMRKKLNRLQPEFDELAWAQLATRLDNQQARTGRQVFLTRWTRIAAALIGAGLLYGLSQWMISSESSLQNTLVKAEKENPKAQDKQSTRTYRWQDRQDKQTILRSEDLKNNKKESHTTTFYQEQVSPDANTNTAQSLLTQGKGNIQREDAQQPNSKEPLANLPLQKRFNNFPLTTQRIAENPLDKNDLYEFLPHQKVEGIKLLKSLPSLGIEQFIALKRLTPQQEAFELYASRKAGIQVGVGASAEISKAASNGRINGEWNGVASLLVEKNISKKWRVGLGLSYLQKFQNNNTNANPNVATQLVEVSEQVRINQLTIENKRGTFTERMEVPLELKLMLGNQPRWRAFMASGVVIGLNLNEKSIYESENVFIDSNTGERIGSNNVFRKTDSRFGGNLDWQVNAGVEYSLNSRFNLQLMPYYRYTFSDTPSEPQGTQTFGLRSVLYYRW